MTDRSEPKVRASQKKQPVVSAERRSKRTAAMPTNELADLQRANADLQRRLHERTAERDEAIEQQTATAEVLQVINSSPGDLAPVFDAMLAKAMRLCGAALGSLLTYDGPQFHAAALHRVPPRYAEFLRQPQDSNAGTALARIVRE